MKSILLAAMNGVLILFTVLVHKIIFRIPTILNVEYGNYKNIMNRNTQKTYVVSSHIKAEWNLYGAFDFKDIKSKLSSSTSR